MSTPEEGPPPPGPSLPPHLKPPQNNTLRGQLLAINGAFAGVAILAVLLRIYVRTVMLRSFKADDYIMLAALTCGIGVLVCWVGETDLGVGRHIIYIKPEDISKIMHWQFFNSIIVMVGISLVKLSIAFVLFRFVEAKNFKRFLWFMVAFLIAFTIACGGTLVFACDPPQAAWNFAPQSRTKFFSIYKFAGTGSLNTAINIITDVVFVATPIPIIWRLQLNRRAKISLIVILSLGVFACVASIIKLSYQVNFIRITDPFRYNSFNLWNSIELYTGIIAACLPSLRPLFKAVLDRTRRTGQSYSSARNGYAIFIPSASGDLLNDTHPGARHKLMISSSTRESTINRRRSGPRSFSGSYAMSSVNRTRNLGSEISASLPSAYIGGSDSAGDALVRIAIPYPSASPAGRHRDLYAGRGIDSGRWGGSGTDSGNYYARSRADSDESTIDDFRLPRQGVVRRTDLEVV